jgi:hypothetical protein
MTYKQISRKPVFSCRPRRDRKNMIFSIPKPMKIKEGRMKKTV